MRSSRAPRYYRDRVKRVFNPLEKKAIAEYGQAKGHHWIDSRPIEEYEQLFDAPLAKLGLGANLLRALAKIRPTHRPLEILEDGPGRGNFLLELHYRLKKEGIRKRITAWAYAPNENLRILQEAGVINELQTGFAERHVPAPVDAIFSVHGSVSYTSQIARKDHFLKLVHALRPGGFMCLAFVATPNIGPIRHDTIGPGFSPTPKKGIGAYRKLDLRTELEGVRKSLAKRGYKTHVAQRQSPFGPEFSLVIHRPKTRKR